MSFFEQDFISKNQTVFYDTHRHIGLDVKREDQIHPYVSGNKFRKIKYNIKQAILSKHNTILTYGGAYSNHIAATATVANLCGLKCIGIIRGEEIQNKIDDNPTLSYSQKQGMHLHFISREDYAKKDFLNEIQKLENHFGKFYRLPEGGSNSLAVKGCEEILTAEDKTYDIIACCVGTGGTLAGLINSSSKHQKIYGFSALKNHQHKDIKQWTNKNNWQIFEDKTFGGYAKTNEELVNFMNRFYRKTSIQLDPIYTGKLLYNLYDLIEKNHFKNQTKILAIHTGGLQGIKGFNQRQRVKNKTCLEYE